MRQQSESKLPVQSLFSLGLFFTLLAGTLFSGACVRKGSSEQKAYTAEQSLAAMEFSEDFHAEVFLKEPQVMSPVEMAFDEDGRIYVAEMLDYPDDPPAGKPARSRIRLLQDLDGDGVYEKTTIFAEHVLEVSSILPWNGGLLVTSAPDILWLKDQDGDGKADVRKVLFTGFPLVNPEARVTNLRYGIDNWIYVANNGSDGRITSPEHPEHPPVLVRGQDFRFRPGTGEFEAASGPAQFGSTFDEWGNQFITQNTIHIRNVVFPVRYSARQPLLDISGYSADISDHGRPSAQMFPLTGPQEWRKKRTELRQKRYDEQGLNRREYVAGYFTAASGGTAYTGDAWPEEYRHSVFTGDVSANLVHRDVISSDGVTFKAARSKNETEFLASRDQWFRPCNFANAPDGNLYMLDVYRLFIETPESIPEEIRKGMDFYAGDSMGRIYRLVANHPASKRDLHPNLSKASVGDLVANLENDNGWHRLTAQRLLVEKQEKTAVPFIRKLSTGSTKPLGRLHALYTLEGLKAIEEADVIAALRDPEAQLRIHALRLAEPFLDKSPTVFEEALKLEKDSNERVVFQLALSLGETSDGRAFRALTKIAIKYASVSWFRMAVLSAIRQSPGNLFTAIRRQQPAFENTDLFAQIASLSGVLKDTGSITQELGLIKGLKKPDAVLNGLARGLNLSGARGLAAGNAETLLKPYLNSEEDQISKAAWDVARYFELKGLVQAALANLEKQDLSAKDKLKNLRALRGARYLEARPVLERMVASGESSDIRSAAIEVLSGFVEPEVGTFLINTWGAYTPEVRKSALTALLSERERMKLLLTAVKGGNIPASALTEDQRLRQTDHPEPEVAALAKQVFAGIESDRAQAVARYRDVLRLRGDQNAGKVVFEQNCARCHLPQKGGRIGPDLSGVNNKTKEELLTSILNPSYAIEPRFINYNASTRDGRLFYGVLVNETPGAITLRSLEGDTTILRKNIAELRASQYSLMPGGFDAILGKQQMADLIAYLRAGL